MICRMAPFSTTLKTPWPRFQGHAIMWCWISQKRCEIQTQLQWNTNRYLYTPYSGMLFSHLQVSFPCERINPLECRGNYSETSNDNKVDTLAVDGWTAKRGLGGAAARPCRPLFVVPNVTAHPSTASVPITVLLCNGPLLAVFMTIKG